MNYYFITGTSRGIGKALAEELLKEEDNYVIGFSRTNFLKHERFEFIEFDLRNLDLVKNYKFIEIIDPKTIVLINNSGLIGDIKHIGNVDNQSIIDSFNVNVIAPAILMNSFVNTYQNFIGEKLIINISSGAGKFAIDSWSSYCATKASLDMFSEVGNLEQNMFYKDRKVQFMSVAPGIVDTQMQNEIRNVDEKDFSRLETFIQYKKDNELLEPKKVAEQLVKLINNSRQHEDVLIDLRNLFG